MAVSSSRRRRRRRKDGDFQNSNNPTTKPLVVATSTILLVLCLFDHQRLSRHTAVFVVEALHLRTGVLLPSSSSSVLGTVSHVLRDETTTTSFVLNPPYQQEEPSSSAVDLSPVDPCDGASTVPINNRDHQAQILCFDGVASNHDLQAWRDDALALQAAGIGARAGTDGDRWENGRRTPSLLRKGVHQIWLQSPENDGNRRSTYSSGSAAPLLLPHCYVGNPEARNRLIRCVEQLRRALDPSESADNNASGGANHPECPSLPPHRIELSYLLYDGHGAASYDKHLDCSTDPTSGSHWRRVSFLLYLGGTDNEVPWDLDRDGGALRVHHDGDHHPSRAVLTASTAAAVQEGTAQLGPKFVDLAPIPGRLVVFDSATVEHEVRPTRRKRLCIVGWFGTPPLYV